MLPTTTGEFAAATAGNFLGSARAHSACAREFEQVSSALVARLTAQTERVTGRAPEVRRSPNRSIVQCGPIAITLAWLCTGSTTVADGELLVIGWRGEVAPAVDPIPERRLFVNATPPTALWEDSLRAVADAPTDWGWTPVGDGAVPSVSSTDLAAALAERLLADFPPATQEA